LNLDNLLFSFEASSTNYSNLILGGVKKKSFYNKGAEKNLRLSIGHVSL